jgi:hypothetical protein
MGANPDSTRLDSTRGVGKEVKRADLVGQYDCVPDHLEAFATLVPKVDIFRRVSPVFCPRAELLELLVIILPIRAAMCRGKKAALQALTSHSPNHTEALGLLSLPPPTPSEPLSSLRERLSSACQTLSQMGARAGTIIRSGEMGCCYLPRGEQEVRWIPPFYSATNDNGGSGTSRVVDPTGAGNGFMGAVAAALDEGKDLHEGACVPREYADRVAVLWGTVAASFIIEQHGLPKVSMAAGRELWNGEDPWERVKALRARLEE